MASIMPPTIPPLTETDPDLLFCTNADCVRCRKGRTYAIQHTPIMEDSSAFDTKNE
jgi:hypothetical protein